MSDEGTGSLASSLHGDPRSTNDADIVAALLPYQLERLRTELKGRFYVDDEDFEHAVKTERFNLVDEIELAKVDVLCVRDEGYQHEACAVACRSCSSEMIRSPR